MRKDETIVETGRLIGVILIIRKLGSLSYGMI